MAERLPQPPPPPGPAARPRRLLALDPGAVRTGVAVSDELGLFAHPRAAIVVDARTSLVEAIARRVAEEGADEVVVGVPITLAGGDSRQTTTARALITRLRVRLHVPVTGWDERLSTQEASRAGHRGARRDGTLDSAAAAILLQAVLDRRRTPDP